MIEFTDYITVTLEQFKKRIEEPDSINPKGDLFMIDMALGKYKNISQQIKGIQATLDNLLWLIDEERRNNE